MASYKACGMPPVGVLFAFTVEETVAQETLSGKHSVLEGGSDSFPDMGAAMFKFTTYYPVAV